MRAARRAVAAAALIAGLSGTAFVPGANAQFTPGAAGLGDPFFPSMGNGGYQVDDYDLRLRHSPSTGTLKARATITAVATQDLSAFDLDYAGPRVASVQVAGTPATFSRERRELVITPAAGIPVGSSFVVEVAYAGRPHTVRDADGAREGWFRTPDGALALDEPIGAVTWFPSNNTPTDKASFTIQISVPDGLKAISNGRLVETKSGPRRSRFTWRTSEPMATYLATVAIGRFRLERERVAGIRSWTALDPKIDPDHLEGLRRSGAILRLFDRLFGPYPFSETGAIVARIEKVPYALETQTRPFYPEAPGDVLVAHELAHQWFGDSVSLTTWPEIWLNEGFATWAGWRWDEAAGGPTTARRFARLSRTPAGAADVWNPPPAVVPGPADLFADSIYVRGAMALEALRQRVGNKAFYSTMRTWTAAHRYGNATITEFIALAEAESGEQLDALFEAWLEQPGKPTL